VKQRDAEQGERKQDELDGMPPTVGRSPAAKADNGNIKPRASGARPAGWVQG
jgi:hypothetical protein